MACGCGGNCACGRMAADEFEAYGASSRCVACNGDGCRECAYIGAESFGADEYDYEMHMKEPKAYKMKWGFWIDNIWGEEHETEEEAIALWNDEVGQGGFEIDKTPYQRMLDVGLKPERVSYGAEEFGAEDYSCDELLKHINYLAGEEVETSVTRANDILLAIHETTNRKKPVDIDPVSQQMWEDRDWYAEEFGAERGYVGNCMDCGKYTQTICDSCGELCCCGVESSHERADVKLLWDDSDNICKECFTDTFQEMQGESFGAEGKVRTMSGKPHTPRKLKKDKDITPEEAAKRTSLRAEAETTYYEVGRQAAKDVFTPDLDEQDSYGLMDSEYMIYFDLTPDELVMDIDSGATRYNQFSWGWGQGWDDAYFDHLLNPDEVSTTIDISDWENKTGGLETYASHTYGQKPFEEMVLEPKEIMTSITYLSVGAVAVLLYMKLRGRQSK